MANLETKYLGLKLKNPLIAGSSSLSETLEGVLELERYGAGAVVMKSLFEEEIIKEMEESQRQMSHPGHIYPEIYEMFDYDSVEDSVTKYLNTLEEAKKKANIPIIASVNCVSSDEWIAFAKKLENAGADALELNVFIMPSDFSRNSADNEKIYFEVVQKVTSEVSIPVSLKISHYFTNLGMMIQKLSETGVAGLVLFNRFFSPDFDIDNMRVVPANIYSSPAELSTSLRWIAIMSERVSCDLAASTGIHDGAALIKQLLAGANAAQAVSTIYRNGPGRLQIMLDELSAWMDENGYDTLDEFRGKMSQSKSSNPAAYERAQFMKHFSGKKLNV